MAEINADQLRQGVEYVDRWLEYQQELKEIPGLTVAIRHDSQLLLSKGYGFADLETQLRMTPDRIFRIASHSKTFTATAIMQLKEQGKLRLDDRMGQYLPWLSGDLADATIRQVLNHTAGIVRDGNESDYWQLEEPFPDDARLRRLVENGGEVLGLNESFKYSNIGYSLLGSIVDAVSGKPYNEYVKEAIVDRLGLGSTGPETNARARERLVTGYSGRRPLFPRVPLDDVETGAMSAATGFYSTAEDLTRYASAHFLGNEELLGDASKREMQQPYWEVEQADSSYGLGFAITTVGERKLVGHSGGFPGHATRTWFDPKDRLVVVILTNESAGPATPLATTAVKIINYALAEPAASDGRDLARFTGRFYNAWGEFDVVQFGNSLVTLSPAADDPTAFVTELEVTDDDTLKIGKTGGYASPGETIRYVRDEDGNVTKVVSGGASSYPLEIYRERLNRSGRA